MKKQPKTPYSNGLSLLEVLLAIVVSATMLIISINYYSNVRSEQKINYFTQQLSHIGTGVSNYINTHPATSLSTVFVNSNNSMTSSLVSNGVVSAVDVKNVWFPDETYQILVESGALLGSDYGPCLKIEVNFAIPIKVIQKNNGQFIKQKLISALAQPNLTSEDVATAGSVYIPKPTASSSGTETLRIQYCAS